MLDLTQAEVAARAGISSVSLMKIERGLSDPRASTLMAIQRVLEASGARFTDHGVTLVSSDGADGHMSLLPGLEPGRPVPGRSGA